MHTFINAMFTLRWRPGQDTVVALLTAFLMVPVYYLGSHDTTGIIGLLVFVVFGNAILNVLFPAYYVLIVRKERPEELGITTHRIWLALALSLVWSLMCWKGLQREMQQHPDADLLPQLIFNGLILWEPFFVFGWLQLRFDRAFGTIPGILLAALCFGAYHLGTYPLPGVVTLVVFGIIYGILFRLTRNLLTLWPLVWSISSSIGTLQGGFHFGWGEVGTYAVILLVQVVTIAWMIGHAGLEGRPELSDG
jgi:membrane protease YdiL (CAAX protease family)